MKYPTGHLHPRALAIHVAVVAGVSLGALAVQARAQGPAPDSLAAPRDTAATDSTAASGVATGPSSAAIERALVDAGLENVSASLQIPLAGSARPRFAYMAYENRRYRHSVEALAFAHRAAGEHIVAYERRRGMVAAMLQNAWLNDSTPDFHVVYPSDAGYSDPPAGKLLSPTFARADLDLGALVDYRVGEIFDPLQLRVDLEPRLVLNPWPGAVARAGIVLPLQNDFPATDLSPDIDRVRPGRTGLDQFAWLKGVALLSASGGYFGDNRWGVSIGAARPLVEGAWLVDGQIDRTGFLAFTAAGTIYSTPDRTSGFAGVTYRPSFADIALRVRGEQFLYGDRGAEVELRRAFGDVEIGYFMQRTADLNAYGVRLDLPVPPMRRSTGSRLRIEPVQRFSASFRDRSEPLGTSLAGVASREDYLRQLNRPALDANADRYERALGLIARTRPAPLEWVSLTGMTGFINTPWAGVIADRGFEAGYNFIPRRWAYDHRGTNDNQVFYTTLGFLPRLESSLRWTRIPGYHSFQEIAPDSRLVDMDRMASARIELIHPGVWRPGLAAGIEDAEGTRRFHSSYAVTGTEGSFLLVHTRASLGYAFRIFDASRYVLDGAFGAVECAIPRFVRLQIEYDSEKWNAAVGWNGFAGLRIRAALLHMESLSVGAGWSHTL